MADKNPIDEGLPVLEGFPLSTQHLVFFTDKGSLTLSAQLEAELAAMSDLSWSSEDESVVTIEVNGGNVTATPRGAGTALITAKLTAKEGFAFDEGSELSSQCVVTVLDDFTIKPANNAAKLLFFANETAAERVELDLSSAQLSAISRVADISWEKTGNGAALPADSSGASVEVSGGSADAEAAITARLTVKAGNEAFFNGDGTCSAPLAVRTFAVPAPVISGVTPDKMLGVDNAAAAFPLSRS
jgi:hypothetical protein